MTELERMLKESLAQAEQLLRNNQIAHFQTLQHHSGELRSLRNALSVLQTEQQALTAHLTRLNAVFESLQPLLTRLNALLPGK